jgi:hypothetical protein
LFVTDILVCYHEIRDSQQIERIKQIEQLINKCKMCHPLYPFNPSTVNPFRMNPLTNPHKNQLHLLYLQRSGLSVDIHEQKNHHINEVKRIIKY